MVAQERLLAIVTYWFGQDNQSLSTSQLKRWWRRDSHHDHHLKQHFEQDLLNAREGLYDSWMNQAQGRLALNLLLQPFSRAIFRGKAEAYQYDTLSTQNTLQAIKLGHIHELRPIERIFLYDSLSHGEDLSYQEHYLTLLNELAPQVEADLSFCYAWFYCTALLRKNIIERFGRFPHRNAILHRESTPEEKVFLEKTPVAPYHLKPQVRKYRRDQSSNNPFSQTKRFTAFGHA